MSITAGEAQGIRRDFTTWCVHSVVHTPRTGTNASGQPIYGTVTTYAARVVYKTDEIRDTAGNQRASMGLVQFAFPGPALITPQDRLQLPDGTMPLILSIERDPDAVNGTIPTTIRF